MHNNFIGRLRRVLQGSSAAPISPRRIWWVAFLAFCLFGTAWSLAMPYDGPADELQHVLRAYAVWSGQIYSGNNMLRAPQSLIPNGLQVATSCFRWSHTTSAHCAATPGANVAQIHQMTVTTSNAVNYSPVYYALAGWPIRIWPTFFGVMLSRLLTTVFMSAFIAFAVAAAARLRHGRWLLAALLVVLTPVVVNLEGGVNPAGPEIVVGLTLWVALIGIIDSRQPSPGLIRLACISAAFLAVFRSFGLEWLLLTAGTAVLGLGWSRLRNLRGWLPGVRRVLADRTVRRWLPVTVLGMGFGFYWDEFTGGVGNLAAGTTAGHLSLARAYVDELWTRTTYYTDGFIALTSYGDVPTPDIVFYAWFGACAALILFALAISSHLNRLRIGGVILATYIILIYPDGETVAHGWWLSQGRYALPFLVGAPLLAAQVLGEQKTLAAPHLAKLTRLIALVLLPIQVFMLYVTMIRFESGGSHLNVLHGKWLPAAGPALPLLLCCAAVLVVGYLVLRMTAPDPNPGLLVEEPEPGPQRALDHIGPQAQPQGPEQGEGQGGGQDQEAERESALAARS